MASMVELRARPNESGQTVVLANGIFGTRTKTFDIPYEEFINRWGQYASGEIRMIQDVFPMLTPMDREFFLTGATEEDWKNTFGEEE